MAVASYNTDTMNNKVDIVNLNLRKPEDGFHKINEFKHDFPPTKMMWIPDFEGNKKDILATTAECLRIWEMNEESNSFIEHKITRNVSAGTSLFLFEFFCFLDNKSSLITDKLGLLRPDNEL